MSTTSGVEFTQQYPLIVKVGYIGTDWNIQPSSTETFPPDGKLYKDKMLERINAIPDNRPGLTKNWVKRASKGAPSAPKFVADPAHIPIVVRPGEYVCFQGDYPFIMAAGRDGHVWPDLTSPDSPFTWPGSQQSSAVAPFVVIAVAQKNLHQQRFFKCEAWLSKDDGQTIIHIDPDTVGTSDSGT